MNPQKTGEFLKHLRKEKGMTQEQLAEHLYVSARTVSRWETGRNMPDLDVLIELADFYDADIREIIDGERKSEIVDQEQKETLIKIADYSKSNEKALLGKLAVLIAFGIIAWAASFVCMLSMLPTVQGAGLILIYEALAALLYSGTMLCIKTNRSADGFFNAVIGAEAAAVIGNIALFALFYGSGSYHNYGLIGAFYSLSIIFVPFVISGVAASLITETTQKPT